MTQLLTIISLLIYTAYCQTCGNTHDQSLLLSISIHGNSINKIGVSNYLSIVESAAKLIVPTGSTRVGINTFGGITNPNGPNTATKSQLSMGSTTWSNVESTIQDLATEDFDSNWANVVSDAVEEALMTPFIGQKYHVIFSVATPIANGYGTTTNPINFNDPCPNSITAKQNNIQQYVVLIGLQGVDYVKEYFSCIVEDPDNDIIMINPSNITSGIAQLQSRVCKSNGIDVKITEVNPVDAIYRPFIEVFNRGAPADISVCWGSTSCSTSATVNTGSYYIGYGAGSGIIPSVAQIGANLGSNANVSNWIATVQVNGIDVESVVYGSDSYWQAHISGDTFELRSVGYNNMYGGNWRMSCYPNSGGSPGSGPVDCHEEDNSCSVGNCAINGAASSCVGETLTNSLCHCQNIFLEDIHACIAMPVPTKCHVYVTKDEVTNDDLTYFAWDRVRWDGQMHYYLMYPGNDAAVDIWHASSVSAAARDDVADEVKRGSTAAVITIQTVYTSPIRSTVVSASVDLTCDVSINEPTTTNTATTTQTTNKPTTTSTTPSTTHDLPGVFLSNICGPSRCDCFGYDRSCCVPFGPDENPDTLTSSSIIPDAGCHNHFKSIEIQPSDEGQLTERIKVKKYGDTARTDIKWSLRSYGIINETDFEDLTKWTDYYPFSKQLNQNLENTLNIEVKPLGNNNTAVIDDGDDTGELILNISVGSLRTYTITYDECINQGLGFQLVATSCTSMGSTECMPLYPYTLWIMVTRSNQLCTTWCVEPPCIDNIEEKAPGWLLWVSLALLVFLLCLSCLVYRFWWKQKRSTDELGDVEKDLQHQISVNEAGLHHGIDVGDIVFNQLATGVPGSIQPVDAFGNELHQRQLKQQNDMVHIEAEQVVVRIDYGQVVPGPRNQQEKEKYQRF